MCGTIPPVPQYAFKTWCPVTKHRDNFTFTLTFIFTSTELIWSRDGLVGIALSYGLHDRGSTVRFWAGARNFSSPLRPERLWNPPSWGSFPGVKAAGA
jgi:hypothetical protein